MTSMLQIALLCITGLALMPSGHAFEHIIAMRETACYDYYKRLNANLPKSLQYKHPLFAPDIWAQNCHSWSVAVPFDKAEWVAELDWCTKALRESKGYLDNLFKSAPNALMDNCANFVSAQMMYGIHSGGTKSCFQHLQKIPNTRPSSILEGCIEARIDNEVNGRELTLCMAQHFKAGTFRTGPHFLVPAFAVAIEHCKSGILPQVKAPAVNTHLHAATCTTELSAEKLTPIQLIIAAGNGRQKP